LFFVSSFSLRYACQTKISVFFHFETSFTNCGAIQRNGSITVPSNLTYSVEVSVLKSTFHIGMRCKMQVTELTMPPMQTAMHVPNPFLLGRRRLGCCYHYEVLCAASHETKQQRGTHVFSRQHEARHYVAHRTIFHRCECSKCFLGSLTGTGIMLLIIHICKILHFVLLLFYS
jgi:hypothetical protein